MPQYQSQSSLNENLCKYSKENCSQFCSPPAKKVHVSIIQCCFSLLFYFNKTVMHLAWCFDYCNLRVGYESSALWALYYELTKWPKKKKSLQFEWRSSKQALKTLQSCPGLSRSCAFCFSDWYCWTDWREYGHLASRGNSHYCFLSLYSGDRKYMNIFGKFMNWKW